MPIQVYSEIAPLRRVLLHRPGQELEHLVPGSLERLLFDDIPYLKGAQAEHDRFAQVLRDNGVEVVYLSKLTAEENVELPLIYRGVAKKERLELARIALEKVGLKERMTHRPSEMSGGQQQRVAIARAIAQAPPVILADEPTGNLDSGSTGEIMEILKGLHGEGRTVILITHDNEIAARAKRIIRIMDGKIVDDIINENVM